MTISERKLRLRLDSWKFWMVIAYFGLGLAGWGYYKVTSQQNTEIATRAASQRAAAQAQVTQCAVAVKNAPIVDGFVKGQRAIIRNSILATIGALANTPRADPLYPVRVASLRRLQDALKNTNQLAGLVTATTPSKQSCNRMAVTLHVPLPFPHPD